MHDAINPDDELALGDVVQQNEPIYHPAEMPTARQIQILLYDQFRRGELRTSEVMSLLVVMMVYLRTAVTADALHDKMAEVVQMGDTLITQQRMVNPRTTETLLLATIEQQQASPDIINELIDTVVPDSIPEWLTEGDEDGSTDVSSTPT